VHPDQAPRVLHLHPRRREALAWIRRHAHLVLAAALLALACVVVWQLVGIEREIDRLAELVRELSTPG